MPEIEMLLRDARPHWPEPPDALEARIVASLGPAAVHTSPRSWLRRAPRSRRLRLLAVGLALAGSGAALAVAIAGHSGSGDPGASASLAFGGPERVARIGGLLQSPPAIAVDDSGATSLTWARAGRVVVSSRPRRGDWSPEVALSDKGVHANQPRIAAGARGAVAIWRARILGRAVTQDFTLPGGRPAGTLTTHLDIHWRVEASARDREGHWGRSVALSPDLGGIRDAYAPVLVMTGAGDAVAGYAAAGRAWSVKREPSGAWGRPQAISSGPGIPAGLTLATAPRTGWVVASWIERTDDPALGRRWRLWTARRTADGVWEAPTALTPPTRSKPFGQAAINDQGEALVAWSDSATHAVTHGRSGSWSAATTVAPPPGPAYILDAPAVGIDVQGRALASVPGPGGSRIARREPGSGWQAPTPVRPDGRVVAVTPDSAGGLAIAIAATGGGPPTLAALAPTGADRGAAALTGLGPPLGLAVGGDGTAAVVATTSTGDATNISVAVAPGRGHR